jgi:hypothetical protein
LDLRKPHDFQRMEGFLRAVAEGPVGLDEYQTVGGEERWIFSWEEATDPSGASIRICAEVRAHGEIRFVVVTQKGELKRVSSTSTVNPYELVWQPSIDYARTLVEFAKARALSGR